MTSYYEKHYGDLYPGHIARSSDIMAIQQKVEDMIQAAIKDQTEGQSWILGTEENAFILTPEVKRAGRYIDQMNLAENNDEAILSIRQTSYRQPIRLSKSSIYSIILKLQNKSELDVPVVFTLQDENGYMLPNMKTVLTLPKNTNTPQEFEIIFDLNYHPTAYNIDSVELEDGDNNLSMPNSNNSSDTQGYDYGDDNQLESSTIGASTIYLVIDALNKNKQTAFDINREEENGYKWNDTDPTFGIVINKNSSYGTLLEEDVGSGYSASSVRGDLYFKTVFSNAPAYKCQPGQAIINGEKIILADTHVSIGGASSYGKVISYIYMDTKGHLNAYNSDPFLGDQPSEVFPSEDLGPHLHIANILTYPNDVNDPVIDQDDESQDIRPRSHHERLRRAEKKLAYTQDIAIPTRFKYVVTDDDWIDTEPNVDLTTRSYDGYAAQSIDALNKNGYVMTTDENGNFIAKVSDAEVFSIPITLKTETSGKVTKEEDKTKVISSAQTSQYIEDLAKDDIKRAQTFAEMKNMKVDITNGKLTLENTDTGIIVATNDKEAKKTEFNPWDDTAANRPKTSDVKPTTRSYTITSGKNGANDWASEFPAMTFYTKTGYLLKKLQIPIYKFKNCEAIKFIIWERQSPNNKTNTVWLKKRIYTSDKFSLKKAKVKKGYQYMEEGFLIDFGKKGLKLPKGQYVIVCLPIVKSGKGTVYVDTYKPEKSQDFCIRYHGAANASHFLLKDRYQEVWYNSVKAQAEELTYSKSGSIVSGVVSWDHKEPIKTIKPLANFTKPEGKNFVTDIYIDIGGGWKKVEEGKDNKVVGSGAGDSFRWKIEFKGDGKDTPVLEYDKKKKYAIKFEITRTEPTTSNLSGFRTLDKNLCFTSKVFDANKILREYIGDFNFALTDNKFSNYEFARVWATEKEDSLLIDISGSDRIEPVLDTNGEQLTINGEDLYYPIYSFHYVDLRLSDMPHTSVDYSNYDPLLEEDEHNFRMKLDTENSYNDDDIKVFSFENFELANSAYELTNTDTESDETNTSESSTEQNVGLNIDLSKITVSSENQVIAKAKLSNTIDLTKYSGLKVGMILNGVKDGTLSGLAIYISSQNEVDAPTTEHNEDVIVLQDGLPDLNSSQEDVIETYANQVVVDTYNDNGTAVDVYYKSIWNSADQKWEWQQLHDIRSYNIYEFLDRSSKTNILKITENNNNVEQFYEIDIDTNSVNMQFVKEIGIMIINENEKYQRDNVNSITITDFKAIKQDYYSAFKASDKNVFVPCTEDTNRSPVTCQHNSSIIPNTSSITITHQDVLTNGEDLCYFDMTSKSTKGFNHIGIQLASDCLLTKNMLELHFRKVDENKNETTIEKIKLPTINYVYYPTTSDKKINLVQIVKKLKTTEKFDKIVLVATNRFKNYSAKLKNVSEQGETELGDTITIHIGNITLYRAETFPMLYPMMRMKFYLDDIEEIQRDATGIRKIGAVIQYR